MTMTRRRVLAATLASAIAGSRPAFGADAPVAAPVDAEAVLRFWFVELEPRDWLPFSDEISQNNSAAPQRGFSNLTSSTFRCQCSALVK